MTGRGLKHQVMSSLRWTAGAKLVGQLVSWAITLLVIRLLVPADYGLMALANVVIGLLGIVAEMGFGASLVQTAIIDRTRIAQIFGAALIIHAGICACLFAVAPLLGRFFDEPRLVLVVQVLAFQFVIIAAGLVPNAMLRRELRYKALSLIEIVSGAGGNLLTLVLAWTGHGVWSLVIGGIATAVMRTLLLHAALRERVMPSFSLRGAKAFVSFGASVTVTRLLWYAFSQTDIVIAGKLLGKDAVGLYSVAVHLASLPMQRAASVVNDVAFSAFARIQHDRNAIAANIRLAVRQASLFAFPALWGLACVAPDLVRLAMGDAWVPAVVPLQIVALAVPLRMIGTIVSTATMSVGRVDIAMWTTLIGTLLAPPLYYIGSRYGIAGLSVAWAAITPVMLLINLYRALPNLGLAPLDVFAEMTRPAIAALAMAVVVIAVRFACAGLHLAPRLAIEIISGALLYLAATLVINRAQAVEALQLFAPGWLQRTRLRRFIR